MRLACEPLRVYTDFTAIPNPGMNRIPGNPGLLPGGTMIPSRWLPGFASRLPCFLALFAAVLPAAAGAQRAMPDRLGTRATNSQYNSRIMLHVVAADPEGGGSPCSLPPTPCETGQATFSTEAPLSTPETPYYYAYVVVTNYTPGPGFRGVQYGIEYDGDPLSGVDILDWTSCSLLEFPMDGWPAPGSGNLQTWYCTTSGMTVAGWFTIAAFGPDVLDLVARQVDDALKVADCDGAETLLEPVTAGAVGFGGASGEDPCLDLEDIVTPPPPPPGEVETFPPAMIMLHGVPAEGTSDRCSDLASMPCARGVRSFTTELPLSTPENPEFIVYVTVKHPFSDRGVYKTGFPLVYDSGIVVREWTSCASIEERYRRFPASGGGVNLTWYSTDGACEPDPVTVAGYFRVEAASPGAFQLSSPIEWERGIVHYCREPGPEVFYNDWVERDEMAAIGFGGIPGSDPCFDRGWEELAGRILVPVRTTTWGRIKALGN